MQDGREEKMTRSALKAAVEQALGGETVVVLDALNYIKGVRYELYCKARAESTTYCVVRLECAPFELITRTSHQRNGLCNARCLLTPL
jgi:protein KTI12